MVHWERVAFGYGKSQTYDVCLDSYSCTGFVETFEKSEKVSFSLVAGLRNHINTTMKNVEYNTYNEEYQLEKRDKRNHFDQS